MSAVRTIFDNCQQIVYAPDGIRECKRKASSSFQTKKGDIYLCARHYQMRSGGAAELPTKSGIVNGG